ncbi:MAG: protein kinase domain-containing protein [Kofleriaceae bacterium]
MNAGSHIGQYRIVREIGAGGMGTVFLGEHVLLGRRAAIKTLVPRLSARREIVERFFTEARAMSAISDPGVVQVFDFGYHVDGSAYIVMELLEGEALSTRLGRLGVLPVAAALRIARQAAGSLASAHARDIVHRDLKPENIFLIRDVEAQSGERTKILDFGICKLGGSDPKVAPSVTPSGTTLGTPVYMSPEQCRGAGGIDQRSDIYALGCVLFHMLTGQPPFTGEGAGDLVVAHLQHAPRAPSELVATIPAEVDELVQRCLAKSPADRFSSMVDLHAAIELVLAPLDGGAIELPVGPASLRLAEGFRSKFDGNAHGGLIPMRNADKFPIPSSDPTVVAMPSGRVHGSPLLRAGVAVGVVASTIAALVLLRWAERGASDGSASVAAAPAAAPEPTVALAPVAERSGGPDLAPTGAPTFAQLATSSLISSASPNSVAVEGTGAPASIGAPSTGAPSVAPSDAQPSAPKLGPRVASNPIPSASASSVALDGTRTATFGPGGANGAPSATPRLGANVATRAGTTSIGTSAGAPSAAISLATRAETTGVGTSRARSVEANVGPLVVSSLGPLAASNVGPLATSSLGSRSLPTDFALDGPLPGEALAVTSTEASSPARRLAWLVAPYQACLSTARQLSMASPGTSAPEGPSAGTSAALPGPKSAPSMGLASAVPSAGSTSAAVPASKSAPTSPALASPATPAGAAKPASSSGAPRAALAGPRTASFAAVSAPARGIKSKPPAVRGRPRAQIAPAPSKRRPVVRRWKQPPRAQPAAPPTEDLYDTR